MCNVRPQKEEQNHMQLTIGRNCINYPGNIGMKTTYMMLVKLMLNSVVSTMKAKFICMDISNFYMNKPLDRYKYLKLKLTDIPQEVINKYDLISKATSNRHVYVKVCKGMYSLPQAELLSQKLLKECLNKHGHFQNNIIPGWWKHQRKTIKFTLVVNNFEGHYIGEEHARHLVSILKKNYDISMNQERKKYTELTLD